MNATFTGAKLVGKIAAVGLVLMVVLMVVLLVLLPPRPAHADTFTVNSTGDPGTGGCNPTECTLREAITASNASSTVDDTIEFVIPGTDPNCDATTDVCTISPTSLFPGITDIVTIDGYTQTGADPNTATTNANNADLKVELSGASAPANAFGLAVSGTGAAGTTIRGLVINRFGDVGVFVNAPDITIEGNFVGTNADGDAALGNGADGVQLLSSGNVVGGPANEAQNVISGNGENGVAVQQSGATGNTISNNHIGTDAGAGEDLGNTESGVFVENAPGITVGGSSAGGTLNILSGNEQHGVEIIGDSPAGKVLGNLIGVNLNGTGFSEIGNTLDGVFVSGASEVEIGGAADTTPGGPCAGECNVISDNGQHGVEISGFATRFTEVRGNRIGTNINGSAAFGNAMNGVRVLSARDTRIGGTTEEARNVISGNAGSGVFISAGSNNLTNTRVEGNFIGISASGVSDLGNGTSGVRVEAPGTFIGGTAAGAGNVISGNGGSGVLFNGSGTVDNLVQGNLIGTNATGTGNLANMQGVRIAAALDNTVGGTVAAAANTISGNTEHGVLVSSCSCSTRNRILRNSIFDNGLLGIELGLLEDGPTPNDNKDPDTGPNQLQNFPVITSASTAQIKGKLNSRPRKRFTIQIFSSPEADPSGFGEGETFLRQKTVKTNRQGRASFTFVSSASAGEFVAATATDSAGNTSEFSQAREVD